MEFISSQHTFKLGTFRLYSILSSLGVLTLGIFQAFIISATKCNLMICASNKARTSTASPSLHSLIQRPVISTIKYVGYFLCSILGSGVSICTNFGLAHNKVQQLTFGNCHLLCLRTKTANYLGRCARR